MSLTLRCTLSATTMLLAVMACEPGTDVASSVAGSSNDGSSSSKSSGPYYCQGYTDDGTYDKVIVPDGYVCELDGAYVKGDVQVEYGGALEARNETEVHGNIQADGALYVVLDDAYVTGDVQMKDGGALEARNETEVHGNIQADGARYIVLEQIYVKGDIQIDGTYGVPEDEDMPKPNTICGSEIGGNLQLQKNRAPFELNGCPEGEGNTVHGNLEVQESYISGFPFDYALYIADNYLYGNLQFFKNWSDKGHGIFRNRIEQNLQCTENYPPPEVSDNEMGGNAEGQCAPDWGY
jgi:hypothetical protein